MLTSVPIRAYHTTATAAKSQNPTNGSCTSHFLLLATHGYSYTQSTFGAVSLSGFLILHSQ
jgi:hypothetical protein